MNNSVVLYKKDLGDNRILICEQSLNQYCFTLLKVDNDSQEILFIECVPIEK